jgi:hypothetical protein
MKRTFPALVAVLALTVAGGVLAQSDTQPYGTTDPAARTTAETTSQPGTSDPSAGSTAQESMPATASNLPLVLVLGLTTLGGALALRLYRLRQAD